MGKEIILKCEECGLTFDENDDKDQRECVEETGMCRDCYEGENSPFYNLR